MARPTKLTGRVQAAMVEALKAGNYAEDAAIHAGIEPRTYYRWMKRGKSGRGAFGQFCRAIRQAEAFAKVRAVTIIAKGMADDWRAAAWYLERKYHQDWGRRDKVENEVAATVRTRIVHQYVTEAGEVLDRST